MKKILFTLAVISSALGLGGCASGVKNAELAEKFFSPQQVSKYYLFRESAMGGAMASLVVTCNDKIYRVGSGEFIECPADEYVNFISSEIGDGVFFTQLLEDNANLPQSNKLFLNKKGSNQFLFTTTSLFGKKTKTDNTVGVENTITKGEAIQMFTDGYDLIKEPTSISPVLRYTAILNPFSKHNKGYEPTLAVISKGFHSNTSTSYRDFLPPQMIMGSEKFTDFVEGKRGVVVYSLSNTLHSPGIWTEDKYHGTLNGPSYIFIETSNSNETLYTYYGGKLASLDVAVKQGGVTYVEFDTSTGWDAHNRSLVLSDNNRFQANSKKLEHLVLNKSTELEPSLDLVEKEGIKILGELLR